MGRVGSIPSSGCSHQAGICHLVLEVGGVGEGFVLGEIPRDPFQVEFREGGSSRSLGDRLGKARGHH